MKLYGSATSPFVQRPLIVARAKGHDLAAEMPPGGLQSAAFAAISPMRRVPVLVCDDGWSVAESVAVARFLDETLDGPALLPDDPRARAAVRTIESLAICELAGLRSLIGGRLRGRPVAVEVLDLAAGDVAAGLAAIERARRTDDRFAVGDMLSHADAILFPMLTLVALVGPAVGVPALGTAQPGLAAYLAGAIVDPVLHRCDAEMRAGFGALVAA